MQTAYHYDNNDRLIQTGGTIYSHDDNGNTLSETLDANTKTYVWDSKNKLLSLTEGSNNTRYTYNPDGIRTSKTESGTTTHYIVDSNRDYAQVLEEVENNLTRVQYTYGHDLINQQRNHETSFYHYDGLGSTRGLSNSEGTFTDSYHYEAFGEIQNQTGSTDNNYLFTGEQYDSSLNQYYLRARYYDQNVGRFTQQDTWMGNNHDPITLHKYLYANANPVSYTDPSGNFSLGQMMTGIGALGALVTSSVGRIAGSSLGRAIGATFIVGKQVSLQLKIEVKNCRVTNGKKCRIANLVVIGSDYQGAQQHIADVQQGRGSNGVPVSPQQTYKKGGNGGSRQWYRNKIECKGNVTSASGKSCDEWPFFTTSNGGEKGYGSKQVSLRLIDHDDNTKSGQVWGRAVGHGKNGDKYLVVPTGPASFYFSHGKFGK